MLWSQIFVTAGSISMLLLTLDSLEGSLFILAGSGLVALAIGLRLFPKAACLR